VTPIFHPAIMRVRGSFAFLPCFVEAEKLVGVRARHPELPVQAFDEGIVGWLAGPAEFQCRAAHEGPKVELLDDEFRPVIEPDRLRAAHLRNNPFEGVDDIAAAETLPHVDRRRQPGKGVDDGQRARILRPSNSWSWTKSIAHTCKFRGKSPANPR
jgi:hypothetical protein